MKKGILLSTVLFVAAASLVFAGGQSESKSASSQQNKKVSVTVWTFPLMANQKTELFAALDKKFNEKYPNITVNVQVLPWAGRSQKMLSAVASGSPPDVAYFNEFFLQMFAGRGALLPLENYIPQSVLKARYSPAMRSIIIYQGHYYLAPTLLSTVAPIYNKRVLAEAGWNPAKLPTNWNELLAMAAQIKQWAVQNGKDVYPLDYDASTQQTLNMTLYPLIWQAGGNIVNSEGTKPAFDSTAGREALGFVKEIFDKGYVRKSILTGTPGQQADNFVAGKTAVIMDADAGMVSKLRSLDPKLNSYALVGLPLKNKNRITYGTVGAWALFKGGQQPAAAAKWIEFMTSPTINVEFNGKTGYMSPIVGSKLIYTGDPILSKLEQFKEYARPGLIIQSERQLMAAIRVQQQNVILGKATVSQALSTAQTQADSILAPN